MLSFESKWDFSATKYGYIGAALLIPGAMLVGMTDLKAVEDKNFLAIFQMSSRESSFVPVLFAMILSILFVL